MNRLALVIFALFIGTFIRGQNLTPQELIQIHTNSDNTLISTKLSDKGFEFSRIWDDLFTKETTSNWYFRPFARPGEEVSSSLTKTIDSTHKTKTTFILYNPFHYKDFINSLIKSKYKFKGIQVIDNKIYSVFKDKRTGFMTTERRTPDKQTYFEILLQTP